MRPKYVLPLGFPYNSKEKVRNQGEQDGKEVSGRGIHLSSQIHQEYTFRHRSAYRTPAESRQEDWISGKEYKELGGKTGVLVGLNLPSARGGTEAGVQSLQQGSCLSQRRNI